MPTKLNRILPFFPQFFKIFNLRCSLKVQENLSIPKPGSYSRSFLTFVVGHCCSCVWELRRIISQPLDSSDGCGSRSLKYRVLSTWSQSILWNPMYGPEPGGHTLAKFIFSKNKWSSLVPEPGPHCFLAGPPPCNSQADTSTEPVLWSDITWQGDKWAWVMYHASSIWSLEANKASFGTAKVPENPHICL